jgi:hypothetical protein
MGWLRSLAAHGIMLGGALVAGCHGGGQAKDVHGDAQADASGDAGAIQAQGCGYSDPGIDLPPCPEGFYCGAIPGQCPGSSLPGTFFGVCVPVPDECPEEIDEVCSCDNVTYGNECLARRAGKPVAFHDRCDRTCTTRDDCGPTAFCGNIMGAEYSEWCAVEEQGRCLDFAPLCKLFPSLGARVDADGGDDLPVCGCDGMVYADVCEATVEARTNIAWAPCDVDSNEDGGVQ